MQSTELGRIAFSAIGGSTESEPEADQLAGVFDGLRDVYREQGYERGYRRAVSDLLMSLALATSDFVRHEGPHAPEVQRLLFDFERFLERRVESLASDHGYVSGGLGI